MTLEGATAEVLEERLTQAYSVLTLGTGSLVNLGVSFFLSLSQAAVSMLKQDYKEGEMTLSSALALAIKVLNKTMDVSKLSAEKGWSFETPCDLDVKSVTHHQTLRG